MPTMLHATDHAPQRRYSLPLLIGLWLTYFVVSVIVYTDHPRVDPNEPLNELEQQGLALFRSNNCQACHQLYGFGGFLGPDLTNRVSADRQDEDFAAILTEGSPPMPAFGFDAEQQRAILAYLRAVDRTGTGQIQPLSVQPKVSPLAHHGRLLDAWVETKEGEGLPLAVAAGRTVWETNACGGCHMPFELGVGGAVDHLSGDVDLSPENIAATIATGPLSMPAFDLDEAQVQSLSDFLTFMRERRDELRPLNDELVTREPFRLSALPWWEFGP